MLTCHQCRTHLLDRAYGLLDPADAAAVDAHLTGCPACTLAAEDTRRMQGLFAAAAKSGFPAVTFAPPAAQAEVRSADGKPPAPRRTVRSAWLNWVVAASLLLAVSAAAGPALVNTAGYAVYRPRVNAELEKLDAIQAEKTRIASRIAARKREADELVQRAAEEQVELERRWIAAEAEAVKSLAKQPFLLDLRGPATAIAGAPNEYHLRVLNPNGTPVREPVTVEAKVTDAAGTELFADRYETDPAKPSQSLKLPSGIWSKASAGGDVFLSVTATDRAGGRSELTENLRLMEPVYTTFLTTDKPMYRPGETVFFRSLTLDRVRFLPPEQDQAVRFEITNSFGEVLPGASLTGVTRPVQPDAETGELKPVLGPDGRPIRGVGGGAFTLNPTLSGGVYTLTVYPVPVAGRPSAPGPLASRKFLVNQYTPDKLRKTLEFDGKSYGPGDTVQAKFVLKEQDQLLADTPITVTAQADGEPITLTAAPTRTDAAGAARIRFTLPVKEEILSASVSVQVQTPAITETLVRPVPLSTRKLTLEFFPEGGDLVAGVPNRVYFRATNSFGKPADVTGTLTDGTADITAVRTLTDPDQPGANQGLGVFEFTPAEGKTFAVKLSKPIGLIQPDGGYPLPEAKKTGVVLRVPTGVTRSGQPIRVTLFSVEERRTVLVGAYIRGRAVAHQKVTLEPGRETETELNPGDNSLGGVTRITVFDLPDDDQIGRADLKPLAERLVFRTPGESLKLSYTARKAGGQAPAGAFVPGARIDLDIESRDETGAGKPAVLWAAVVNQSVITMADDKTERLLPTHFLLSGEVQSGEELEHTDFLLTDHPKAGEALDLLLGTQGWRRFAEQAPAEFRNRVPADELNRLQLVSADSSIPTGWRPAIRRVFDEFWPKYETTLLSLDQAEQAKNAAYQPGETEAELARAEEEYQQAIARFGRSAEELKQFDDTGRTLRQFLPALLTVLAGLAIGALVIRHGRFDAGSPERKTLGWAVLVLFVVATGVGLMALYTGTNNQRWRQKWAATPNAQNRMGTAMRAEAAPGAAMVDPMAARPDGMPPPADAPGGADLMRAERAMPMRGAMEMKAAPARGGVGGPQPKAEEAPGNRFGAPLREPGNVAPQGLIMRAGRNQLAMDKKADPNEQAIRADGVGVAGAAEAFGGEAFPGGMMPGGGFGGGGRFNQQFGFLPVQHRGRLTEFNQRRSVELSKLIADAVKDGALTARQLNNFTSLNQLLPPGQPLPVREYAHTRPELADDAPRADFTETLLWQPVIVTSADGKATVTFSLSDDVAPYRVLIAGHTLDGRIGGMTGVIEVRKPFALDPKLPQEVSSADVLDIPVLGLNGTDAARTAEVTLSTVGLTAAGGERFTLDLAANSGGRKLVRLTPNKPEGELSVRLDGTAGGDRDSVVRTFTVMPDGFPASGAKSDVLEQRVNAQFALPEQIVPGSMKLKVTVYPNTLSEVQGGLEGLLREPHGCFEQTSTTNYPNVLILDYLNETNQANPDVSKRAKELLDRGYGRLTSFECQKPTDGREGYEWFGGTAPPHEALTAYGLLQFTDMARVHPVDAAMLKRTKEYLLSARDGRGGFKRNGRALDTFGYAPAPITDAYIVWAISESERTADAKSDLDREVDAVLAKTKAGEYANDPYYLGLAANALLNRGRRADGEAVLKRLVDLQQKDGSIPGAKTSITNSQGEALLIETTGLAVLGWLKANETGTYRQNVDAACQWIGTKRGGYGGYGSTQSTILALKALIAYARNNKRPAENGTVFVRANGAEVGKREFTTEQPGPIVVEIPNAEAVFRNGQVDIAVETDAKQTYPCTVSWECRTRKPNSSAECPIRLTTRMDRAEAAEGETMRMTVGVQNTQRKQDGMVTAIVGIPAGLKLPEDMKQLKALTERPKDGTRPTVSYWEKRGRELIFYWHGMNANETIEVGLDLIADIPGETVGPASRAYLYYGAEHKHWVDPVRVKVTAK